MNYASHGNVIADSVAAIGLMIAFYYGLTGFACFWYYRRELRHSQRDLWFKASSRCSVALMLFGALIRTVYDDWHPNFGLYIVADAVLAALAYWRHLHPGHRGMLVGLVLMLIYQAIRPAFFRGEVLNANTPVLVPEDAGIPIEPS